MFTKSQRLDCFAIAHNDVCVLVHCGGQDRLLTPYSLPPGRCVEEIPSCKRGGLRVNFKPFYTLHFFRSPLTRYYVPPSPAGRGKKNPPLTRGGIKGGGISGGNPLMSFGHPLPEGEGIKKFLSVQTFAIVPLKAHLVPQ